MYSEQNTGQNHTIKTGNKSFERVEQFKYLGTSLMNQNCIHEEIESRLKSGNAYHSVQNLMSSSLLSQNIKIKIYKSIIFPVPLNGCETWSLTPREEHRLRVSENMVLRKIFGPMRDKVTGVWRRLHNEELYDLYSLPIIIQVITSMRLVGQGARMGERRGAYRGLIGKPEGRRPLGKPRHRREDIKMDLLEVGWGASTELMWLRIGTGGGLL
jgi:hypothetical protein